MANTAKKPGHTDVGGVAVPNDMIAKQEEPKTTALAVPDEKMIAEIKQLSNTEETAKRDFPILKLQHLTTADGEPNPLRGHFTIIRKNDMGEWDTEDLGETIKFQFLMQRYFLKMVKKNDVYTSGEFESDMDVISLWKRNGDQSEVFAEGTPFDLQKRFLTKDDKNRVRSELKKLSKLYLLINGELVVWKLSLTGTIAWSKYNKAVPFTAGVITAAGRTEELTGTVKYYAPVFKAEERIKDLVEVKNNIEMLRDMLPKRNQDFISVETEETEPFKG
jgi:hypothetical protein